VTSIRAKSVCVFRHQNKILLTEGYDPTKNEHYLIPLGGGIEFGETSERAAIREVFEEVGAETYDLQLLGVLENLFVFDGTPGHEIVFIYEAKFVDENLYQKPELDGFESNGVKINVRWFDQAMLNAVKIYPHGIVDLL
jgi:ADP-ribose pyrophosphatase YjhB (NUDIX family)